jgi:elongation factor G
LNTRKLLQNLWFIETYKQSGGRGKFGDIVFKLEPADEEGKVPVGLQFVNAVKGGNVPKEYIPSVEKGFREAMKTGPGLSSG